MRSIAIAGICSERAVPDAALWIAPLLGFAFGFLLERAGLAHAPRLAGAFYFTDFTVFKVLFTALLTAMLGVFWLHRVGVLDIELVRANRSSRSRGRRSGVGGGEG